MIAQTLRKIWQHGFFGTLHLLYWRFRRKSGFDLWRCRNAPRYINPTDAELLEIEQTFEENDIIIQDYSPQPVNFSDFKSCSYFPADYHGGIQSGVWEEKLLEHWIAAERLGLFDYSEDDIYIDVAACGSPWAQVLRTRHGIQAYAIDLQVPLKFSKLDYYLKENAIKTNFPDSSVRGMSLQCAFEMFLSNDDVGFILEINRILKPGGKVVILPLYMHTHYCAYSTPEFFGKGFSDSNATEYVQMGIWGVPSSRKYNVATLKDRLINNIEQAGLQYELLVLRNKKEFGEGIYCHFVFEIQKPKKLPSIFDT